MLTSKQRSNLRALASTYEPVSQLGKSSMAEEGGSISETFLNGLSDALEARELIKITVLKNAAFTARQAADVLAEALGAECVATIGHKVILYRKSSRQGAKHIEF